MIHLLVELSYRPALPAELAVSDIVSLVWDAIWYETLLPKRNAVLPLAPVTSRKLVSEPTCRVPVALIAPPAMSVYDVELAEKRASPALVTVRFLVDVPILILPELSSKLVLATSRSEQ